MARSVLQKQFRESLLTALKASLISHCFLVYNKCVDCTIYAWGNLKCFADKWHMLVGETNK